MVAQQIVWLCSRFGTIPYMCLGYVTGGGLVVYLCIWHQRIATLISIKIIHGQATFIGISGCSTEKEKTWIPMILHFLNKSAIHIHTGAITGIIELSILASVLV